MEEDSDDGDLDDMERRLSSLGFDPFGKVSVSLKFLPAGLALLSAIPMSFGEGKRRGRLPSTLSN